MGYYLTCMPKSCIFIEGVVVSNSIVEAAAMSILMTYLTDIRKEKLTVAAATVNVLEGISGVLAIATSFYKDNLSCYSLIPLSSFVYSLGLGLLCISSFSRTKIELPLLYMALVLVALGKAGASSSCIEDFLEDQLKDKSNKDEKRDNIRKSVSLAKCQILGVILGNVLLALFSKNWTILFGISALLIRFTLGFFLIGTPLYIFRTTDKPMMSRPTEGRYFRFLQHMPAIKDSLSSFSCNHTEEENNSERKLCTLRSSEQIKHTQTHLSHMVLICLAFLVYRKHLLPLNWLHQ